MGRQLVLDGVANGSLNIKFVVTDMEDFKIYIRRLPLRRD